MGWLNDHSWEQEHFYAEAREMMRRQREKDWEATPVDVQQTTIVMGIVAVGTFIGAINNSHSFLASLGAGIGAALGVAVAVSIWPVLSSPLSKTLFWIIAGTAAAVFGINFLGWQPGIVIAIIVFIVLLTVFATIAVLAKQEAPKKKTTKRIPQSRSKKQT